VLGARSNGITSVAVTWRYGREEELRQAAPDRLVAAVVELGAFINTEE
jgi:phosphoglycolate phosphatase-like HAD superfamily hydrolase